MRLASVCRVGVDRISARNLDQLTTSAPVSPAAQAGPNCLLAKRRQTVPAQLKPAIKTLVVGTTPNREREFFGALSVPWTSPHPHLTVEPVATHPLFARRNNIDC